MAPGGTLYVNHRCNKQSKGISNRVIFSWERVHVSLNQSEQMFQVRVSASLETGKCVTHCVPILNLTPSGQAHFVRID